jgi:hypothetical protein
MASSLDDMEAYELLQIELDRSLKNFTETLAFSKQEQASILHFLNHWIEYICFVRHMSTWKEIVAKETEEAFKLWYSETFKEASFQKEPYEKILVDFQDQFNKA